MVRTPHRRTVALVVALAVTGTLAGCSGSGSTTRPTTTEATTTTTTTPPLAELPSRPWVVGHRGASASAPEHTFASYDLAVEQGADFIELDLQLTADGVLVVLHDPVLDRTLRGPTESCTGRVDERTAAEVTSCDAGTWFDEAHPELADPAFASQRVPTFAAVLARYGTEVRYYVETKKLLAGEGMEEAMVADLEAAGFTAEAPESEQVVIQSFDADSLRTVAGLRPDLRLVKLQFAGETIDAAALDEVASYADGISPDASSIDATLVAAAHERCLTVVPYTVDDEAEMADLLALGVDGIITNRPSRLVSATDGIAWSLPCSDDGG
ncbi:MAG: glycerophosphodiester phosphodiesterase [Actinobacteria bacterium]|nr:glycerophosphodiester phosphodiesterase [Actinomycetota bacterium]